MSNKGISYLSGAVNYLEDFLKDQELITFYRACLTQLQSNNKLIKANLPELHPNSERDEKTYVSYLDKLIFLIDKHQLEIDSYHHDVPTIKRSFLIKVKGGGSGKPTYFYVDFENSNNDIAAPTITGAETPITNTTIRYRMKSLKRTPWYLKISKKLFVKTKSRQIFMGAILAYFIITPIALGWALFHISIVTWSIVFFIYFTLFKPIWNIIQLHLNKTVLLVHVLQPLSAICISKVRKVHDNENYLDVDREILCVEVDGTCPICYSTYQLKHSVQIDHQSILSGRIIGKCLNNPIEHRFSFDKDLMLGKKI
jgi:hypothetical protein